MSEHSPNGHPPDEFDPNSNGARALAVLGQFLNDDDWHPQPISGADGFRTLYAGEHGEFRCLAMVRIDLEQFIFYTVAPIRVLEEARLTVAEYITRANYGLRIGNFELDFRDGEVRFKSSIDFEDEALTPNLIRNTIYPAVKLLDTYLPGLMKVAFGGVQPVVAIAEIEGDG
jgi:hypothetical protein